MKYDFDNPIDRRGTCSVKWDAVAGIPDMLPLWIADMDFQSPRPVIEALQERVKHGIFGYTVAGETYYDAVIRWMKERHNWNIEKEWICPVPGIVPALNRLVYAFTDPEDGVIIQPPVYPPFFSVIEDNGRNLSVNRLTYDNTVWRMDLDDLRRQAQKPDTRMALLCSPHNPVGRVWKREELVGFGEVCFEAGVQVVSDEIHGDIVMKDHTFVPFASIGREFAERSIICTAPSKTFNIAGLYASNIIIQDNRLREKFRKTLEASGFPRIDLFGLTALEAAYEHGREWLDMVLDYIYANYRFLKDFVEKHIPQIRVSSLEGTYLVWLDCRNLNMDGTALREIIRNKAQLCLNDGFLFGPGGEGFQRINIACPRAVLQEALTRFCMALRN